MMPVCHQRFTLLSTRGTHSRPPRLRVRRAALTRYSTCATINIQSTTTGGDIMQTTTRPIVVQIRLSASERDMLARIAQTYGLPLSTCIRMLAMRAASSETNSPPAT